MTGRYKEVDELKPTRKDRCDREDCLQRRVKRANTEINDQYNSLSGRFLRLAIGRHGTAENAGTKTKNANKEKPFRDKTCRLEIPAPSKPQTMESRKVQMTSPEESVIRGGDSDRMQG